MGNAPARRVLVPFPFPGCLRTSASRLPPCPSTSQVRSCCPGTRMTVTGCTQQYRRPEQPSLLRSLAPMTPRSPAAAPWSAGLCRGRRGAERLRCCWCDWVSSAAGMGLSKRSVEVTWVSGLGRQCAVCPCTCALQHSESGRSPPGSATRHTKLQNPVGLGLRKVTHHGSARTSKGWCAVATVPRCPYVQSQNKRY